METWGFSNLGARSAALELLFPYDASADHSTARLTAYDGQGGFDEIVSVQSTGDEGYASDLSGLVAHEVDTASNAYVLNWSPREATSALRLCGMRLAYRTWEDGAWSAGFNYLFIAGSAFRPRDSVSTLWRYEGSGCISAFPTSVFYDGFESGGMSEWSTVQD